MPPKKAAPAKSGSKRPAPEDDAPVSPPKRGPGRPRKVAPAVEDDVMESIEAPARKSRAAEARSPSRGPAKRASRSRSPVKKLQPISAGPRQRSASQGRRAASPTASSKVTPSRKLSNKGMSRGTLSNPSAGTGAKGIRRQQHNLQTLEGEDESDTPVVGESNIHEGYYSPIAGPASRARTPSRRAASSPKKSDESSSAGTPATPAKDGNGTVTSFTNPVNIPNNDNSGDYVDKQGRGPFKNPFHEKMPLKEQWYRRMPPVFPFGETPHFEQKMSDQINADLSRSHQETLDVQKKQKGSGGLTGALGNIIGAFTSGTSSPAKNPRKKSTAVVPERFNPWKLPEIDTREVDMFAHQAGITA